MKIDNKYIVSAVAIGILLAFVVISSGQGENSSGSSKEAVAGSLTEIVPLGDDIIINQVDIHANKDLVISVSSEAILYTLTGIKGKPAKGVDSSTAGVTLQLWAEVDGVRAYPPSVTFAERIQTLDGHLNESQWLNLTLNTTNCNAFNFITMDLPQSDNGQWRNVTIHANVTYNKIGDVTGVRGAIGQRTVIVEEVNVKNNYNF